MDREDRARGRPHAQPTKLPVPKVPDPMLWAGTAFRPPRKDDDEGWLVVEQLLGSGFRFVTTNRRRRVPRTLKELEAWRTKAEDPIGWVAECQVRMPRGASSSGVRCGQHALLDGQVVLVWHSGKWREGRIDISPRGRVVQVSRPPRRTGEIRPTMDGSKPANGQDPRQVGFYPAAASGCNVGRVRQLRGPHLSTWAWCRRRSSMAATAATSPSSFPQSSTGRFEVMRVEARS